MKKIRIGIDVGGTFTHAVAIDNDTLEILGKIKVHTTHFAKEGVAKGIIESLNLLLKETKISPDEVCFVAHSTTQATNALLEGDVAKVGIISAGSGIEGMRVKTETNLGNIEISKNYFLPTFHHYLDTSELNEKNIKENILSLKKLGAESLVSASAFSVDNPEDELKIIKVAQDIGIPATATHYISSLYGLKIRTRTACINASILPKMLETANMTEKAIKETGIKSPLMIMQSNAGVMDIEGMRKKPILTILSGPAAGVAAALMYAKVSNGIFLEVGGTSTDISLILDGKPKYKSAKIGGHQLFLRTLDVRTAGVAGGSLIRLKGKEIVEVGPRSAHISGLSYASFTPHQEIMQGEVFLFSPKENDSKDYVAIKNTKGKIIALTPTCAANVLGLTRKEDTAAGFVEAAKCGFGILAKYLGLTLEETAEKVLDVGSKKLIKIIDEIIKDYKLEKENIILVGGGGGVASLVPFVAEKMKLPYKIVENQEVISSIGVALALLKEEIERNVVEVKEEDIFKIRYDVEEKLILQGAQKETIEVQIEFDKNKNLLRAIGSASQVLEKKDKLKKEIDKNIAREIAASSFKENGQKTELIAEIDNFYVFGATKKSGRFLNIFKEKKHPIRVLDKEGIIRLQKNNALIFKTTKNEVNSILENILQQKAEYGDGGITLPTVFLVYSSRIVNLGGLINIPQILSLAQLELKGLSGEEKVLIIVSLK